MSRRARLCLEPLEPLIVPSGGLLDPSFGGDGTVNVPDDRLALAIAHEVLPLPGGSVLLAGIYAEGLFPDQAAGLVRLTPEGLPDPTFGVGGVATPAVPAHWSAFYGAARQADGRIVAAGLAVIGDPLVAHLLVARFRPDGRPDPSFGGGDGLVVTATPWEIDNFPRVAPVVVQPDGRILTAVAADPTPPFGRTDWLVVRYTSTGALDRTFDADGYVFVDWTSGGNSVPRSIALQPDGRIVVAGDGPGPVATRLNANGSPDESFGVGGKVAAPLPGLWADGFTDLIPRPDGKLVALVRASDQLQGNHPVQLLLRYQPNGALDPTFGVDGIVRTDLPNVALYPTALAAQADGRMLVVGGGGFAGGYQTLAGYVSRYTADGVLDASFAPTETSPVPGIVFTDVRPDLADQFLAVAATADGRIVAAGDSYYGDIRIPAARYFAGDPYAVPVLDDYAVDEDTSLAVAAAGVLANDLLPSTAVLVDPPRHGTVTLEPDGSFSYVPEPDFAGADAFTYKLAGASGQTATARLTVRQVNDAPVGTSDAYTLPAVGPFVVAAAGVLANDTDVDGDPLTALLVDPPAVGTLTLNPDGSFRYDFPEDLFDAVTFTYQPTDGQVVGPPVTVTFRRGSSVAVAGNVLQLVGGPGTDVVRLRKAPRNGLQVELFTATAVIRQTVYPATGFPTFVLADVYLAGGDDRLDAIGLAVPVRAVGGAGSDVLRTGKRADVVFGDRTDGTGAGNDLIETGAGNDDIRAGDGQDLIDAGSGNDVVTVAGASSWVTGGAGNDVLVGGAGADVLDGGSGKDLIAGGAGADLLEGGGGTDVLFDGSATVADPVNDSLSEVLAAFKTSHPSLVSLTTRLAVTPDGGSADTLTGGGGTDWFWSADLVDVFDLVGLEPKNGVA
jgi:uncharacterized delta-60 repeat protein